MYNVFKTLFPLLFFHKMRFASIYIHQILNTSLAVPLLSQNVTECLQPLRSLTLTTTYAPRLSTCEYVATIKLQHNYGNCYGK